MSDIDQLPAERDIHPDRHAYLRSRLLTAIAEPPGRTRVAGGRRSTRFVAVGAATAALTAIAWVAVGAPSGSGEAPDVYALGDSVLSPNVREAGRKCLGLVRDGAGQTHGESGRWPVNGPPRLVNHLEQPGRGALLLYQTQSTLIYCSVLPAVRGGPEPREFTDDGSLGIGIGTLRASPWLPGPISLEDSVSTDLARGYLYAAGRVTERVARVVLDDGAGNQSAARLAEGTFIVFSDGRVETGVLISYDAVGKEVDRRPATSQPEGRCYVDPAGNLVNPLSRHEFEFAYRSNRAQCTPAEPWTGRHGAQSTPR